MVPRISDTHSSKRACCRYRRCAQWRFSARCPANTPTFLSLVFLTFSFGIDRRSLTYDARVNARQAFVCVRMCVWVWASSCRFTVKCRFSFRYNSEIQMHLMSSDFRPWTSDPGPRIVDLRPRTTDQKEINIKFPIQFHFSDEMKI